MSQFPSVAHVAVTVTDLPKSVAWYCRLFDAEPVLDEDTGPFHHVVFALNGGQLFGLHAFPTGSRDATAEVAFDERRVGLDHVAFSCADRNELDRWTTRLEELGIQHGGVVEAHYGVGLSFRDPDNIALEFFAPPA